MLQTVAIRCNILKQKNLHTAQTIGQRIAFLRMRMDKTQQHFADFLDISRGKLSQIEIDRNEPDIALIRRIATKCSVSYAWLIDGDGILEVKQSVAAEPEERYVTKKELEEILKKLKP